MTETYRPTNHFDTNRELQSFTVTCASSPGDSLYVGPWPPIKADKGVHIEVTNYDVDPEHKDGQVEISTGVVIEWKHLSNLINLLQQMKDQHDGRA